MDRFYQVSGHQTSTTGETEERSGHHPDKRISKSKELQLAASSYPLCFVLFEFLIILNNLDQLKQVTVANEM